MSIYKPCDIRGDADGELSPALYRNWGLALGHRLPPGVKFAVGGDVRRSTPQFMTALIEGLCQSGLDVVNLGVLPTPMIYHALHRLRADGCAVVTASHNPGGVNGLKWLIHNLPPTPDDIASMAAEPRNAHAANGRSVTTARTLDVSFDYVADLQETFVDSLGAQLHVVVDPMHGCWAEKARRYLHAIFPQCIFSTIHDTVDPEFGGATPDCSRSSALADLCETVYRERAHLGIAFDGDGDRLALVDNDGVPLSPEETVDILFRCLGGRLSGERFVHDLKYSNRIFESAREWGAEPIAERSGHAFLRTRMVQSDALLGAEVSGHFFHRALHGGEDGLYTACLVIAHLAGSQKSLADLRRECPAVYMTSDVRIDVPLERQPLLFEQVRNAWSDFPQQTTDGVRIDTPSGWILMRSSVTEAALTFRFEALDWNALDDLIERFCDTLPEVGDELWARCRAALGSAMI